MKSTFNYFFGFSHGIFFSRVEKEFFFIKNKGEMIYVHKNEHEMDSISLHALT